MCILKALLSYSEGIWAGRYSETRVPRTFSPRRWRQLFVSNLYLETRVWSTGKKQLPRISETSLGEHSLGNLTFLWGKNACKTERPWSNYLGLPSPWTLILLSPLQRISHIPFHSHAKMVQSKQRTFSANRIVSPAQEYIHGKIMIRDVATIVEKFPSGLRSFCDLPSTGVSIAWYLEW